MTRPVAPWKRVLYSYPCPECEAEPGNPCVTASGKPAPMPHAARGDEGMRCATCGVRLPEGDMGPLCPHHQLLRNLEAERATKHLRRDP